MSAPSAAATGQAVQEVRSSDWAGKVTVGAETARRLSKIIGREVREGEVFDLGLIASSDNPERVSPNVFCDPRLNADLYPDF